MRIKVCLALSSVVLAALLVGCGGSGSTPQNLSGGTKDVSAALETTVSESKPVSAQPADTPAVVAGATSRDAAVTKVVDVDQATHAGPSQYWHRVTGLGANGHMTWTYVNGGGNV